MGPSVQQLMLELEAQNVHVTHRGMNNGIGLWIAVIILAITL